MIIKNNSPVYDFSVGDAIECHGTGLQAVIQEILPENRVRALCLMLGTECKFVVSMDRIRRALS